MASSTTNALIALLAAGCGRVEPMTDDGGVAHAGAVEQDVKAHLCPAAETVEGIDVSTFQGSIQWSAVRSSGRKFALTRISDGLDHPDATFATNWADIQAAGMIRGAYQYFEPGEDAVAQADMVSARVGQLAAGDLPVMLDAETTGGLSPAAVAQQIHRWVDAVTAGTGKAPMVYTGAFFWDDNVQSADFAGLPLVIAWYDTDCPGIPDAWSSWTIHQYTSSASVPGISGDVDADVFNGSLAALQALAGDGGDDGGGDPPPPPPDDACTVHSDHKLYCDNRADAAIYAAPTPASAVVNHLRTTFSWFDCWGTGALHAGGNTTWYHTLGDDTPSWGWVPAVDLQTTSAFDANPAAGGLQRCP